MKPGEHCSSSISDVKRSKSVADLKLILLKYSEQCFIKGFPSTEFYNSLPAFELKEFGIFINTSQNVIGHKRVILVGESECVFLLEPYAFCHMFIQHGAKAIISGGEHSRFFIHKSDDSTVTILNNSKSEVTWLP